MLGSLSRYSPELFLTVYDNMEFIIRIVLAAVLGIIIGIERTARLKEAGIRTHCIVAMTAAAFMILSKYAFLDLGGVLGLKTADPARIAAQVVSGVSFLGAGIIFKHGKNTVKGLTTAAGMWATSAVGMAIGAGLYWVGIIETVLLLILQVVLHRFQYGGDALTEQQIRVVLKNEKEVRKAFQALLESHQCIVEDMTISRHGDDIQILVDVRSSYPIAYEQGMRFMRDNPDIREIKIEDM